MSTYFEAGRKTFQRILPIQNPSTLNNFYRADLNITKHYSKKLDISFDIINLFNNDSLYSGSLHPHETLLYEPGTNTIIALRYRY